LPEYPLKVCSKYEKTGGIWVVSGIIFMGIEKARRILPVNAKGQLSLFKVPKPVEGNRRF